MRGIQRVPIELIVVEERPSLFFQRVGRNIDVYKRQMRYCVKCFPTKFMWQAAAMNCNINLFTGNGRFKKQKNARLWRKNTPPYGRLETACWIPKPSVDRNSKMI